MMISEIHNLVEMNGINTLSSEQNLFQAHYLNIIRNHSDFIIIFTCYIGNYSTVILKFQIDI